MFELKVEPTKASSAKAGIQALTFIIDQLVSISSIPSPSLRDSATEAAFSLAMGLIPLAAQLKEAKVTAERQLKSDGEKRSKNPKTKAFAEQKEEYSEVTLCLLELFKSSIYLRAGIGRMERSHCDDF